MSFLEDKSLEVCRQVNNMRSIMDNETDPVKMNAYLNKLRTLHGEVLLHNHERLTEMIARRNSVSDEIKISISTMTSAAEAIHLSIKKYEKKILVGNVQMQHENEQSEEKLVKPVNNKITVETRGNELTVSGLTTSDSGNKSALNETQTTDEKTPIKGGRRNYFESSASFSDSILNTQKLNDYLDAQADMAEDSESDDGSGSDSDSDSDDFNEESNAFNSDERDLMNGGGKDRDIYALLIWNKNCGHSVRFYDEWKKFVKYVSENSPATKCISVMCGNNDTDQVKRIVEKSGTRAFPSLYLFNDEQMRKHEGNTPFENVVRIHDSMIR